MPILLSSSARVVLRRSGLLSRAFGANAQTQKNIPLVTQVGTSLVIWLCGELCWVDEETSEGLFLNSLIVQKIDGEGKLLQVDEVSDYWRNGLDSFVFIPSTNPQRRCL